MTDIILVGNPNTGKTTLFNTITSKNEHVGNWHGITVASSTSKFRFYGNEGSIVDLPGIYSLSAYSGEEKVAISYLESNKDKLVVCVVDANTMRRNLLLAIELIKQKYNVVVAVNMAKEVDVNYRIIEQQLGVPVVPIDARSKKQTKALFAALFGEKVKNKKDFSACDSIGRTFEEIDKILNAAKYPEKTYGYSKLDKFLYNKYLAFPIFLVIVFVLFFLAFGPLGEFFNGVFGRLFEMLADFANAQLIKINITPWAHSLLSNGIIAGIGVVVSFLPQVVILNLGVGFLEDTGYLSRVAICFDNKLKKVGLSGKSVMSILLGYGCTTSALLTTRALDSVSAKKKTSLVLPFASCNAKLPIFLLISSVFFSRYKVLIIFVLYLFSILLGLFISLIATRITKKTSDNFVMEVPPLRIQNPIKTLRNALSATLDFVKRVGTTLIICSVFVWLFSNITFSFTYAQSVDESILYSIAHFICPVFAPIGLNNWGAVVALIIGLSAKEMVVSSLAIINGVAGNFSALAASFSAAGSVVTFTPASALSFLVFILIYSPCLSAISVMSKEIGKRFACFVFVFQMLLAYFISFVVYQGTVMAIGKNWFGLIFIMIVLALMVFLMIKYSGNKKSCKNCKRKCNGNICCPNIRET